MPRKKKKKTVSASAEQHRAELMSGRRGHSGNSSDFWTNIAIHRADNPAVETFARYLEYQFGHTPDQIDIRFNKNSGSCAEPHAILNHLIHRAPMSQLVFKKIERMIGNEDRSPCIDYCRHYIKRNGPMRNWTVDWDLISETVRKEDSERERVATERAEARAQRRLNSRPATDEGGFTRGRGQIRNSAPTPAPALISSNPFAALADEDD